MQPSEIDAELTERVRHLQADNVRLRRLLNQRDAPAELRHRLRNTLALLREIIRRSAVPREEEAADYAAQLEDRLTSLMRVHEAIDRLGEIDLHTAVVDELMTYAVREGEQLHLRGPDLLLRPRAAQALGLAFHELAINAVEHGAAMTSEGRIDVSWRVETTGPGPSLVLVWRESGMAGLGAPARRGFGTTVLTDMICHNLNADADIAYAPGGIRYSLRLPFPPRIGCVAEPAGTAGCP